MKKIGITGGIGSGKSTVCRIFQLFGVPVFNADAAARDVMNSDTRLIESIKQTFGAESYTRANELNRKYLAQIVFNDKESLEKLNLLVHPAVFRSFDSWLSRQPMNIRYIVKESALLFESGSSASCDETILVLSPEELRISRVMHRDGSTALEVKARMDKQMSDSEKTKLATHVILNDEKKSLLSQALKLHSKFSQTL